MNTETKHRTMHIISDGERLSDALARHGMLLRRPCGGAGVCGQCRVFVDGVEVLACQTRVMSPCEVEIPTESLQSETLQSAIMRVVAEATSIPTICETTNAVVAALDIGTTTLAMRLLTPSGSSVTVRPNPQRACGDDLMSRIGYASESEANRNGLQQMVVDAAREMLDELLALAAIPVESIACIGVAGNTVMQQLFWGIDTASLAVAPFTPAVTQYPSAPAVNVSRVETMPILGGFVGGDVTGGVLTVLDACEPPAMLIDLGTNGEIVLATAGTTSTKKPHFTAAATAAGPAFEGARLRCGMVATSGAIERVSFDAARGEVVLKTIDDAPPVGICGSGLFDAIATLLEFGVLDSTGRLHTGGVITLVSDTTHPRGGLAWELVTAERSGHGKPVVLTQRDIREFQLACGAVRAGIALLLARHKLRHADLQWFCIAGGFGQHISLSTARRVGLVPRDVAEDRVLLCGNTSLAGATHLATAPDATLAASLDIQTRTTHIDLASQPNFAQAFAEAMLF